MFAREWKCRVPFRHLEGFVDYLKKTGLADTQATPGCMGGEILQRMQTNAVELTLLTYWESLEAIKTYVGNRIEVARLYPEDERFDLDPDRHVTHYEVIEYWR